ncbi:MAG: peptidase M61 [Burkholderiaceae bacterium]|nr:peptidase M61 [Burkholderiaceae bacterium]
MPDAHVQPSQKPAEAALHYTVHITDAASHRFEVDLRIAHPAALQRVSLPAWIPGSYLIREFTRHLHGLRASQGRTARLARQIDKATWEFDCDPHRPLTLRYTVYAFDDSVRMAWLDTQRGFFNGTSLFLRVHGQESSAHTLTLPPPPAAQRDWQLATAMTPLRIDRRGFGTYRAADYDELVDHPVELGAFWCGQFEAAGVPHRFVVAGAPASFDGERLLHDARQICEAAIRLWHGTQENTGPSQVSLPPAGDGLGATQPMPHYLFMLNVRDTGYGGLEHRASTALVCGRRDLPRLDAAATAAGSEDYLTLLGLIAHEYFHAWNVKRLKPAEFAHIDYERENYTRLLWFFEGFTSYYDDLLLRRAGLIDDTAYLKLLTKTVNQVRQAPARQTQSAAQASFDAWVRYYRPDENTPNSTISYYAKGALVALCLDLTLRQEGRATLDDAMRALWQRCCTGANNGAMCEDDFAAVLAQVGGRSFESELAAWVHGTGELPLRTLLQAHGVQVREEPAQWAQALGLRVSEGAGGITLKVVLDGSAAAQAGMAAGDDWLGIEFPVRGRAAPQGWRLTRVDDLPLYAGAARTVSALVARDRRLLRLPLTLPQQITTWRLLPQQGEGVDAGGHAWPGR